MTQGRRSKYVCPEHARIRSLFRVRPAVLPAQVSRNGSRNQPTYKGQKKTHLHIFKIENVNLRTYNLSCGIYIHVYSNGSWQTNFVRVQSVDGAVIVDTWTKENERVTRGVFMFIMPISNIRTYGFLYRRFAYARFVWKKKKKRRQPRRTTRNLREKSVVEKVFS